MAAISEGITPGECLKILSALEGLPVTAAWQCSEPGLMLEIGRLRREVWDSPTLGKKVFRKGRATAMIVSCTTSCASASESPDRRATP